MPAANAFRFDITANDRFTAMFKKADAAAANLTKRMSKVGSTTVAAVEKLGSIGGGGAFLTGTTSFAGIVKLTQQWADAGNTITNAAYRIGTSTGNLARFQAAARLAGVSGEDAATGVAAMAKNIGDALSNRNPQMAGYMQQLGIRARYAADGTVDLKAAYEDLGKAIATAPTAQGKNAILDAFGQPQDLRYTIEHMADLNREAGEFHPKAQQAAEIGERLKLSLNRLGEGASGLSERLEVTLGPGLLRITDRLGDLEKKALDLTKTGGAMDHVLAVGSGIAGGAIAGAGTGALIGGALGIPAGPAGMAAGAGSGAIVGAVRGGVIGGLTAAGIDYYGHTGPGPRVGKIPGIAAYEGDIQSAAGTYGVRPGLIAAVIQQESGGDPTKRGDGGRARGLMQMHPDAANDAGYDWDELDNPRMSIFAGTAYLKKLLDHFGGDERRAVMAYNGGARTVDEGPGSRYYDQANRYADQTLARPEAAGGTVHVTVNAPAGTTVEAQHSGSWPVRVQYSLPTGATNP